MKSLLHQGSALKPLANPVFRTLWLATVGSNIGTWMQSVSAAWVMTSLSNSSLMVALLQSASSLPTVFFSIPGGALADIVDRRRFMIGIQIAMALLASALTLMYFLGVMTPWLLLFFTFSIGIGTALSAPAWFATTPELVPPQDLAEAITLNGIGVNAARAIGPALAGIVISLYSPGLSFALNALSFLGLIVALLRWKHIPKTGTLPAERFFSGMKAGLRYVRQSRHMHRIFAHAAGFFTMASSIWALMPLVARGMLHQGATGYGLLLTSMGLGSVIAAFALPFFRSRFSRNRLVLGASLLYAASVAVIGTVPPLIVVNMALFCVGMAWIATVSSLHVTAQTSTAAWVRARAVSVYLTVLFGGMGFGSILWGGLADVIGVPHTLLVAGAGLAVTALALSRITLPKFEASEFEPSPLLGDLIAAFGNEHDERPVLISVEYEINPEEAEAFLATMRPLEAIRRRDGALFWGVFQSVEEKRRFTEYFFVESWLEHLRQHHRVTFADKRVQEKARQFHRGTEPPKVSHLLMQS